jgi:hypothetical protein
MIRQLKSKNNITSFFLLIIFIIFFSIKYKLFADLFPGTDQAFYTKWIIDLGNSKNFFPSGSDNFYLNLLSDNNSFLHNYFRRIFNDVGVIYNTIPILINLVFAKISNYNIATYNILSIFFNCSIPLLISIFLLRDKKLSIKKYIYVSTLCYLFITSFFAIFFLAPFGIHNYSLLFLIMSVIVFNQNIKKTNFFNLQVLIFGILIPCFSHKFNVIIIFSSIFFLIILRSFNNFKFKKDLLITTFLFLTILSPIFIFTFFGERNLELLKIFFSGNSDLPEQSFIIIFFKYLSESVVSSFKIFLIYFWKNLGIIGTILFIISFFNKKFVVIKFFIISLFLLFIFLPLSPYIDRLFNYFLILSAFLICSFFSIFFIDEKKMNRIMQTFFIVAILYNFSPLIFSNLQNDIQNQLANRYSNNEIWNRKIDKIIKIIGNDNVLFYRYLARDVYFSNYNKYDNTKNVYSLPSIYDLSNKYINEDNQYIKNVNFDKKKFRNTYILSFGSKGSDKELNERFCFLQKKFYEKCGNLEIVNYSNVNKPLKYEGNTHIYMLNLYKSLD